MYRPIILALLLLAACASPETPAPPVPVVQPAPPRPLVLVGPAPLSGRLLADSIAAGYGLVAGLPGDYQNIPDDWQRRWPVGPGWIPLMPGRLPGLRAWLTSDSLQASTHGDDATDYTYSLTYPAFLGPRADSLRRHLSNISGLPTELAAVRRLRLYKNPEPRQPWAEDGESSPADCEWEETNTLDCFTLGAYVFGADTVVSTAGTTYYIGHCVHGNVGQVQATYSLRQQRLVGFDDLFRPELRRALHRTVSAYVLYDQQWNWRSRRHSTAVSLIQPLVQWRDSLTEYQEQARKIQLIRRPDLPPRNYPTCCVGSFSSDYPGDEFYFGATGVVFVIGYDLGSWKLLLPYAALAPYLCGPNDEPTRRTR